MSTWPRGKLSSSRCPLHNWRPYAGTAGSGGTTQDEGPAIDFPVRADRPLAPSALQRLGAVVNETTPACRAQGHPREAAHDPGPVIVTLAVLVGLGGAGLLYLTRSAQAPIVLSMFGGAIKLFDSLSYAERLMITRTRSDGPQAAMPGAVRVWSG